FASGILLCIPTVLILIVNSVNLGSAIGLFAAAGKLPLLLGLLIPHGLIELTSVVIAGAAGLRLGWTIVDPGDRPRRAALQDDGRRLTRLTQRRVTGGRSPSPAGKRRPASAPAPRVGSQQPWRPSNAGARPVRAAPQVRQWPPLCGTTCWPRWASSGPTAARQ